MPPQLRAALLHSLGGVPPQKGVCRGPLAGSDQGEGFPPQRPR